MKKKIVVTILSIILAIATIGYFTAQVTGKEVLEKMQRESIDTVVIEMISENSEDFSCLTSLELSADELSSFFEHLGNTRFRNLKTSPFAINTEIRYYLSFYDLDGREVCRMKFYGNDVLLVDYIYGTQPADHDRFKITSTSLGEWFEDILN